MTNHDLLGKSILDYHQSSFEPPFLIHYKNLEFDEMPIDVFFRDLDDMPVIERYALSEARGKILDIGAGAGAHSLLLQDNGSDVIALDTSKDCCKTMKERGVMSVINENIFELTEGNFDTVLLLMNGIGIAENLEKLTPTIRHLNKLLNDGGQILFDSSDLSYLDLEPSSRYFGEMEMMYEYSGIKSDWGSWLYVDPHTLIDQCESDGIDVEIIIEDETSLYLARIKKW